LGFIILALTLVSMMKNIRYVDVINCPVSIVWLLTIKSKEDAKGLFKVVYNWCCFRHYLIN